jgi:hypothetical protein
MILFKIITLIRISKNLLLYYNTPAIMILSRYNTFLNIVQLVLAVTNHRSFGQYKHPSTLQAPQSKLSIDNSL